MRGTCSDGDTSWSNVEAEVSEEDLSMVPTPVKLVVGDETFEVFVEQVALVEKHLLTEFSVKLLCPHAAGDIVGLRLAKALRDSQEVFGVKVAGDTNDPGCDYKGALDGCHSLYCPVHGIERPKDKCPGSTDDNPHEFERAIGGTVGCVATVTNEGKVGSP